MCLMPTLAEVSTLSMMILLEKWPVYHISEIIDTCVIIWDCIILYCIIIFRYGPIEV